MIMAENRAIDMKVPKSPSDRMKGKFLMKFYLLKVYPAANMMGGSMNKKKLLLLKGIMKPLIYIFLRKE